MIRGLALTASFLVVGAMPALAQTHPPSHNRTHPHDHSGHAPTDSAQHAAMHAVLLGSWNGTFDSPQGMRSGFAIEVAQDSAEKMAIRMSADRSMRAGAASGFAIDGDTLHWTQALSGTSCKATAVLSAATSLVPGMMKGRMACEHGDIAFTLFKKTG